MIYFLTKGLLRDKSRSLFPVIIITTTVTIVIFAIGFMRGSMNNVFLDTAIIISGHEKVVTRAYKEESQMLPNDLALLNIDQIIINLNKEYPDHFWSPRITFGGLLDIPDKTGETKDQGLVIAMGIDLLNSHSRMTEIWELDKNLVQGRIPETSDEVLISQKLATKLNISIGDTATYIGTTMHNAFTTYNFSVVGTFDLRKGQADNQMMLVDISGAQIALDMENAASEIFGFTHSLFYDDDKAVIVRTNYNNSYSDTSDIFSPIMLALRDSSQQMGSMVDFVDAFLVIIGGIFLVIVTIVLWNMGLMNGLRRHGEFGLRLAIGESKNDVYRTMIIESVLIGFLGTIIGTGLGLSLTYYLQKYGIDYSEVVSTMSTTSMVMPNVFYAKVTPDLYYIGFIPGVIATVFGTMLAGLSIYKREMAQLFKELET
ncbi:MAG: ABC transporter permease [Candidatus Neomarinimicrobiota bacterium]